jgi:hypothetical protein
MLVVKTAGTDVSGGIGDGSHVGECIPESRYAETYASSTDRQRSIDRSSLT